MIYLHWIKQGANSLIFQLSLGSIVFHLGLSGKFQLLCSWAKLLLLNFFVRKAFCWIVKQAG